MRFILIMIMLLMTGCAGIGGFAPSGIIDYSCEPNCKTTLCIGLSVDKQSIGSTK